MTTHKEALTALVHEMEYVLSCINENKVSFDGDDFHEALRLGKEALSQTENDKERCVGCEACIDTACGRDECPKGWPKAAQPEQEPVEWYSVEGETRRYGVGMVECAYAIGRDEVVHVVTHESVKDVAMKHLPTQRTWVGLTDDDLKPVCDEYRILFGGWVHDFARAIEAKLKEKNS